MAQSTLCYYANTPETPGLPEGIKARQHFYFTCEKCGAIDTQVYCGPNYVKITCRKCNIKAGREKAKQHFLEIYGVDNPAKIKSVQERIKATNLKRYGVTSPGKSDTVKEKTRATLLERYGHTNPGAKANHEKFLALREGQCENLDVEWLDKNEFRGKYDENGPIFYHFKCKKCGNLFKDDFHGGMPICRKCHPMMVSQPEEQLLKTIMSFYNGEIIQHDRHLLGGRELDLFFPEKKLAIEFNGTYWHGYRSDTETPLSEFKRNIEWKRLKCQEAGVRLINIDEADYEDRPEVFHAFIKDALCEQRRIYARDTEFKPISKEVAKSFCEQYHVNGYRNSSECYGLYFGDELVTVATFSKNKTYGWECIRLCYKTCVSVIGGWEKIQKHFGRQFLHYVNLKYFTGKNDTGCGYRFVFNKKAVYRNQLQTKEQLERFCHHYDSSLSAFNNCLANGGIAIFDCGNERRIYNQKA